MSDTGKRRTTGVMRAVTLELDDDLIAVLQGLNPSVSRAVRELIVLELYRRAEISVGKAAELLDMPLLEFIRYSGTLGIPYIRMTGEEWEAESARIGRHDS
jgi:hypothetical protein